MTTHASPHRRHLTGEINPDVVALLHHLPSLLLPPTTATSGPLASSPGFPCEGFRQAAETYRLVLQGVSESRYSTVADVLRGMTDVATTTTASDDSGSLSAGSPRYCRWRDLSALEKAVSDASKTTQATTTTADAMYR